MYAQVVEYIARTFPEEHSIFEKRVDEFTKRMVKMEEGAKRYIRNVKFWNLHGEKL